MIANNKRINVSKNQFSGLMYYWLAVDMDRESIKEKAGWFKYDMKNEDDYQHVFNVLLVLGMWIIVKTCEQMFEDEDKRDECLDGLHALVYEKHYEGGSHNYEQWMKFMADRYAEYNKAMKTEHPSTPLYVLASAVNKHLFGEVKEDPFVQEKITAYIGLYFKHLRETSKKYRIE